MKYPLEKQKHWHTDQDYKKTDGDLVTMSPKKFLKQVRPMDFDKRDMTNINRQLKDLDSGEHLEPLQLRTDGTEDGRHRAIASMIKGIDSVPVLKWPNRKTPKESAEKSGKGIMSTIKKVVKKFRKDEKYK